MQAYYFYCIQTHEGLGMLPAKLLRLTSILTRLGSNSEQMQQ